MILQKDYINLFKSFIYNEKFHVFRISYNHNMLIKIIFSFLISCKRNSLVYNVLLDLLCLYNYCKSYKNKHFKNKNLASGGLFITFILLYNIQLNIENLAKPYAVNISFSVLANKHYAMFCLLYLSISYASSRMSKYLRQHT
jgi:hypothetical protein